MKTTRASSVSQPIPVPSQAQNYEKMQGTRDRTKSFGGGSPASPYGSPCDGTELFIVLSFMLISLLHRSDRSTQLDRFRRASIASSSSDLANSLSPPAVRFTMDATLIPTNQFTMPAAKPQTRMFVRRTEECRDSSLQLKTSMRLICICLSATPPSSRALTVATSSHSKLLLDASPLKFQQKATHHDGN